MAERPNFTINHLIFLTFKKAQRVCLLKQPEGLGLWRNGKLFCTVLDS
jgi:hypothetical protein